MGGGREFGSELAQAIRRVLEQGEIEHVTLSKRAVASLDELRDVIPLSVGFDGVEATSPGRFKVWTFAGSLANRTRMMGEAHRGAYRFDGLSVDYRQDPRLPGERLQAAAIEDNALEELVQLVKFHEMLPAAVGVRIVRARRLLAGVRI